jgi:hypothetical protein
MYENHKSLQNYMPGLYGGHISKKVAIGVEVLKDVCTKKLNFRFSSSSLE